MKLLILTKPTERLFRKSIKESHSFHSYPASCWYSNVHYALFSEKEKLYTGLTTSIKTKLETELDIPLDEAFFKRYVVAVPPAGLELDTSYPEQNLKFHFLYNHKDFHKHCELHLY